MCTVRARVLTVLESVNCIVQRVTVVRSGMYNRSGDGVCCVNEVKVGMNAAYSRRMW